MQDVMHPSIVLTLAILRLKPALYVLGVGNQVRFNVVLNGLKLRVG